MASFENIMARAAQRQIDRDAQADIESSMSPNRAGTHICRFCDQAIAPHPQEQVRKWEYGNMAHINCAKRWVDSQ